MDDTCSVSSFESVKSGHNAKSCSVQGSPFDTLSISSHHSYATAPCRIPPVVVESDRTVHKIRMSALRHNFTCVESAANRQKCSVIVVVKADGYGHGAIETALHLATYCGAEAFAVATLEEAVALRQAFMAPPVAPPTQSLSGAVKKSNVAKPNQSAAITRQNGTASAPTSRRNSGPRSMPSSIDLANDPSPCGESDTSNSPSRSTSPVCLSTEDVSNGDSVISSLSRPTNVSTNRPTNTMRPNQIRILVLGPPVGYPRCFDLYYHYNIELMVSGPEVAQSLMDWVADSAERKRIEVQKAATDLKADLLSASFQVQHPGRYEVIRQNTKNPLGSSDNEGNDDDAQGNNENKRIIEPDDSHDLYDPKRSNPQADNRSKSSGKSMAGKEASLEALMNKETTALSPPLQTQMQAATLSNMHGKDLAKEVRAILIGQQNAAAQNQSVTTHTAVSTAGSVASDSVEEAPSDSGDAVQKAVPTLGARFADRKTKPTHSQSSVAAVNGALAISTAVPFKGIEEAAKYSRIRELAQAKVMARDSGEDDDEVDSIVLPSATHNRVLSEENDASSVAAIQAKLTSAPGSIIPFVFVPMRKRLRWHAGVDSGMGRMGFKSVQEDDDEDFDATNASIVSKQVPAKWKFSPHADTVSIIKEMYEAEVHEGAPIEFYGMCTHMAEACSTSTYTQSQMTRFLSLLKRVRQAGISVPTVSTDNSAALLTTNLTHFDPVLILKQPQVDTRGFVRTGGAIYGQRPAFPQLRAISTLTASVRHIAILQEGESVGYDRAYIAKKDVRIATLTIGFADGYPRELGNGVGRVSIRGEVFPIVGNICMDMLMVELGPLDNNSGTGAKVTVGDTATLWGPEHEDDEGDGLVRLQDLQNILKTTQSALTCGLNKTRVRRQYV